MKQYDEIKDIIHNKLGLTSLDAYKKYLDEIYVNKRQITVAEIEQLSPDNIHNGDFWRVVEETFGLDCVVNTTGRPDMLQEEGNRMNLGMARLMGALGFVDDWRHFSCPMLEIGAGYGNLKSYVLATTAMKYTGVDVKPKVPGVIEILPTGLLPESITSQQFNLIYSSNVFQHLSTKQRSQYFKDIQKMLMKSGVFTFNLLCCLGSPETEFCGSSEDGKAYLKHYGQFTEVPSFSELCTELRGLFRILYINQRCGDNLFNFTVTRLPEPPPLSSFSPAVDLKQAEKAANEKFEEIKDLTTEQVDAKVVTG